MRGAQGPADTMATWAPLVPKRVLFPLSWLLGTAGPLASEEFILKKETGDDGVTPGCAAPSCISGVFSSVSPHVTIPVGTQWISVHVELRPHPGPGGKMKVPARDQHG